MRRFLVLFGAIALMSALVIPAWASTSVPAAAECVAAAEAARTYWLGQAKKDPEGSQREVALDNQLIERLGRQDITPAMRKQYKELIPDFRDVFVRRCLMKHPAS